MRRGSQVTDVRVHGEFWRKVRPCATFAVGYGVRAWAGVLSAAVGLWLAGAAYGQNGGGTGPTVGPRRGGA